MNWPTVALGDVAHIERSSIVPANIVSGSRYVGLEHIENGGGSLSFGEVSNGELASNKFHFGPHHILFGKLRPYLAKIVCPEFEGICSTDILPIAPGARVDRRYLFHFLRCPKTVDWASGRTTGANLPRLSPHELARLEIPLPPLDEQRRIAAILDKVDALRRKRKRTIELLDHLTQSIFLEMFGDPVRNPKEWRLSFIGSLTVKIGSGATPVGGDASYKSSGVSLIRSMNVRDQGFEKRGLAFIDDTQAAKLSNVVVSANDVLLNITGASVARVCTCPADVLPARVNQHVSIIRPTDGLLNRYVCDALRTTSMKSKLLGVAESGATRQAITKTQIEELLLPIPPMPMIENYNEIIESHEKASSEVRASASISDLLFSSLQSRAFSGQL